MKKLKFSESLVPIILSGEKNKTWRSFDDKDLQIGDELEMVNVSNGEVFAKSQIVDLVEKKYSELSDEDYKGHEPFKDKEAMYKQYQEYYGSRVTPDTLVKVIEFKLISAPKPQYSS